MDEQTTRPPRDDLVRALRPGPEIRSEGDGAVMVGRFTAPGEWAEIDSVFEGHFLERSAPGAYAKTIAENRDRIRVTFNHGQDPELGDKVLGSIRSLSDDTSYEVPLFPSVPPLIVDGLRAGQYGSSYRFRVLREDFVREPGESEHNPEGLPERTILEAQVFEFGPVTYPAYAGASAGIRSMTDEYQFERLTRGRGLRKLWEYVHATEPATTSATQATFTITPTPTPATATSEQGPARRFDSREEYLQWIFRI